MEHLPGRHRVLGTLSSTTQTGLRMRSCDGSVWEAGTEFKVICDYTE